MPRLIGPGLLTLLTVTALLASGDQALAHHVQCGDVITEDTTLDSDLIDCPGHGLLIGADNVTVDLNGHIIDGDGDPGPGFGCDTGIANGRFDGCSSNEQQGHDGVTIRGGTVREFAHGVQVVVADRNSVSQLRLYDNSGFGGIATYLMSNGRIEGNRALDNRTGIAVYEPKGRMTITGNVAGRNSAYGIELAGGVTGDRLEDNVTFGNGAGMFIFSASGLLVSGNRSFGNRGTGMSFLWGAQHVEGNRAWDNGFAGIDVTGDGSRVERNTVFRNASTAPPADPYSGGIIFFEADDNRIVGNRVFENGGRAGIMISAETGGNTVASNHVRDNTGHGIFHSTFLDERGMAIAHNHSIRNGADGIHVSEPERASDAGIQSSELRGNRTDRNGDDGIEVRSDEVTVVANRATSNFDLGIDAVPGTIDGGRNRALANGNALQCVNIFCR